jgi:hypothetical protein
MVDKVWVGPEKAARPSMGRVDARFADWRMEASHWGAAMGGPATFALDYTLKSLRKILDGLCVHTGGSADALKDAAPTPSTAR